MFDLEYTMCIRDNLLSWAVEVDGMDLMNLIFPLVQAKTQEVNNMVDCDGDELYLDGGSYHSSHHLRKAIEKQDLLKINLMIQAESDYFNEFDRDMWGQAGHS